jgi:hypothetical protein
VELISLEEAIKAYRRLDDGAARKKLVISFAG